MPSPAISATPTTRCTRSASFPGAQPAATPCTCPIRTRSYVTRTAMNEDIVCLLGGRVAEQLVLEDISTGASNDLERATATARAMVTRYGFSERLGPVVYGSSPDTTFLGRDLGQGKGYSEDIAAEIDHEIRDIVDEAYERARRTLADHMTELHKVAAALMEREKLSGEEFKTLMEGGELPPFDPDAEAKKKKPPRQEDEEGTLTAEALDEGLEEGQDGAPQDGQPLAGGEAPLAGEEPEAGRAQEPETPAPEEGEALEAAPEAAEDEDRPRA